MAVAAEPTTASHMSGSAMSLIADRDKIGDQGKTDGESHDRTEPDRGPDPGGWQPPDGTKVGHEFLDQAVEPVWGHRVRHARRPRRGASAGLSGHGGN